MDTLKRILGVGLAVALMAGGASVTAVSVAQAAGEKATEAGKPSAEGEKKAIKQGEKPAKSAGEEKSRGFKKGEKAVETMGTMGKEKTKETTKP